MSHKVYVSIIANYCQSGIISQPTSLVLWLFMVQEVYFSRQDTLRTTVNSGRFSLTMRLTTF